MGLDLRASGYPSEELHIGYIGFGILRCQIAKSYNQELGEIYEKPYKGFGYTYSESEIDRYNQLCDDDLDLLLNHSDCEGKLTYSECRKISIALNKFEFKYPDEWRQDYKRKFYVLKDMIDWCSKNRKTLWFR
jgi:hypothetical protein